MDVRHVCCGGMAWLLLLFPSLAAADAICVANSYADGRSLLRLRRVAHDAESVCAALPAPKSIVGQNKSHGLDFRQLFDAIERQNGARHLLLFYSGHADLQPNSGRGLVFPTPNGNVPYTTVQQKVARAASRWAGLILNGCHTGWADVRSVGSRPPVTVIGAGYGDVSSKGLEEQGPSLFADVLADALEGAADQQPGGDCDGVVTDGEVAAYVNRTILDAAYVPSHKIDWKTKPFAVVRRQAYGEVPLVWVERSARCRAQQPVSCSEVDPSWLIADADRRAFTGLCEVLTEQAHIVAGEDGPLPGSPTRYLLVVKTCSQCEAWFTSLLQTIRGDLPDHIRAIGVSGHEEGAARLAKAAWSTPVYVLTAPTPVRGVRWLRLTRPRRRTVLWTHGFTQEASAADVALTALEHVPRRIRVLSVNRDADTHRQWAELQFTGPVERRAIRLRMWPSRESNSIRTPEIDLSQATVSRCPGGEGQCFRVPIGSAIAVDRRWDLEESP